MSQVIQLDAVPQLLIEKGIISKEEFLLAGRRVEVILRSTNGLPEYEIEATEINEA